MSSVYCSLARVSLNIDRITLLLLCLLSLSNPKQNGTIQFQLDIQKMYTHWCLTRNGSEAISKRCSQNASELGSVPGSLLSFAYERNSVLKPFQWTGSSTVNLFYAICYVVDCNVQRDCKCDFKYTSDEIPQCFFPMKNSAKEEQANFSPSF